MRVIPEPTAACRGVVLPALFVLATCAATGPVAAQSLTPMRGEVRSFSDKFAVRVFPGNPYKHRIKVEVRVYDEAFNEVPAEVVPRETMIGADDRRSVLVMVPFGSQRERKVRVCAESVPFDSKSTRLKTQVCGRFLAQRIE